MTPTDVVPRPRPTHELEVVPALPPLRPEAVEAFVTGVQPGLVDALETLLLSHLEDAQAAGPGTSPAGVMALLEEHPELHDRALDDFDAFEASLAEAVARRTGRTEPTPYCRVVALTATGTVRLALRELQDLADEGVVRPTRDVVAAHFAELRHLIGGQ